MKIGFIWHSVYPWDVRLEKIIKACAERGHTVCLVCRGRSGLPRQEEMKGLKIHRVVATESPLLRSAEKVLGYPFFFSPVWIRQTLRVMRQEKVDLLMVRDLPLALMAGCLGKMMEKPVILDMAENFPAALIAYENAFYKPFLVGNGWLPRQYEKISLKTLDHVLVVVEEQKERLQNLGVDPSRITIKRNIPELSFYRSNRDNGNHRSPETREKLDLLFVGKLDAHRGTHLLIQAMPELVSEFANLRLTLVGDGTEKSSLMELARSLGLGDAVDFPGWVEFSKVPAYIRRSSICLIPHLKSEHTETTLPNKLFDYMAFAKPVIAADCRPLKRVIDETNCGLTFRSGDVAGLQGALRKLLLDTQRESKGQNGKNAVEEKYNWDVDKNVLLELIQRLESGPRA
jgi:glycosyltransferase involved in cell wall biosynthesis